MGQRKLVKASNATVLLGREREERVLAKKPTEKIVHKKPHFSLWIDDLPGNLRG